MRKIFASLDVRLLLLIWTFPLTLHWTARAEAQALPVANPVRLGRDGWYRLQNGDLFVPLGGFRANVIPIPMLGLSRDELARTDTRLPLSKRLAGPGVLDIYEASDEMFQRWFKVLSSNGITALRLFPRALSARDGLDLCGKVNPDLRAALHRIFALARPYNIRFLLHLFGDPGRTCYQSAEALNDYVLPRYSEAERQKLTPAQARFILDRKHVGLKEYFTDPDVLACQQMYLGVVLEWVASEPQIFALEIYNEQGWINTPVDVPRNSATYAFEDAEIRWTAEVVKTVKQRLPDMAVCLSHPGFGITGYDALRWSKATGVDFYSSHFYERLCGSTDQIDFAAVTAATGLVIAAGVPNFPGEWGILKSPAPEEVRRLGHRDAIWLTLMAGTPGFMQWMFEFLEEYRWPSKVFRALPKGFSPSPPEAAIEIAERYRVFHDNTRYSLFSIDKPFPAFEFNKQKQADRNIQQIYGAYKRSLELGVPIRFVMRGQGIPLEQFMAMRPDQFRRPIRAHGGYQLAYLKDANSPTWIAYLRSRKIQDFGGHFLGVPAQAPLRIELQLPAGRYTARLIDLNANSTRSYEVGAKSSLKVAKTGTDDYVLVITRRGVKFEL